MTSIQGITNNYQTTSVNDYVDLTSYTGSTGLKCNIYQINNTYDSNPVNIQSSKMALRMTKQ